MEILRAASFPRVAWKNGGGITAVVAVAGGERPGWRVSVARIDRDGPFSDFDGYDRTIVQLSGGPVVLAFATGDVRRLAPLVPFRFAGEAAVEARLAGEPARDLNVMTLRETYKHDVAVVGVGQNGVSLEAGDSCGVLYVADGTVGIAGELASAGDAVRLDPGTRAIVEARGGPATAIVVRIFEARTSR